MSARRDRLVQACAEGDRAVLQQAGWMVVFEALNSWWSQHLSLLGFADYVELLGDESPRAIYATVEELTKTEGEFRPAPAAVRAKLYGARADARDAKARKKTAKPRPDQSPEALAAVARLVTGGAPVCACVPRPVEVWKNDDHVVFCTKCNAIEAGQAFQAEDAGLCELAAGPMPEVGAVLPSLARHLGARLGDWQRPELQPPPE